MFKCWRIFLFLFHICKCTVRNIATNNPASQSSTYSSSVASRAVDGIDGLLPSDGSCSHTAGFASNPPESKPWWEVDLRQDFLIQSVAISHVDKGPPRVLHDFSIEIYEDVQSINNTELCYYHVGQATKGTTELYMCKKIIKGRYVRITINGQPGQSELLILCEVRVFVTQVSIIPSSFKRLENAEISTLPFMTYSVQGYGQCAMKCYVLPMCRIFSVKSMSNFYQCDIFMTNVPKLVANSTGSPGIVLYIN